MVGLLIFKFAVIKICLSIVYVCDMQLSNKQLYANGLKLKIFYIYTYNQTNVQLYDK